MAADLDLDALGLLTGLEGQAREERIELIQWLLGRGFGIDQICRALVVMLVPANRMIGDDGAFVSARVISESTGIELDLLQRLQRAAGLPRVDDPDTAVQSRADGESVVRLKSFVDRGFDADQVVAIVRVLAEGLGRAAELMRQTALQVVLRPGATELQLAQDFEVLARELAPDLGPMVDDLLRL